MIMSAGPVRGIGLDVAGVLVLPEPRTLLAGEDARFAGADWDAVHYLVRMRTSGVRFLTPPARLAEIVGVPTDVLYRYLQVLEERHVESSVWTRPVRHAVRLLRSVRGRGVPIAVLSNTARPMVRQVLEDMGLSGRTPEAIPADRMLDSSVTGFVKPAREAFMALTDALGTTPAETLFVGDTLDEDVEGALGAGLNAIHLTPYGACEARGHRDVMSLSELVEVVLVD